MKRFKEYLTEGTATELHTLLVTGSIPFSQKMWSRITGKKLVEKYGLHVTDMEGLDTILKRVVGRKKSLPVMTDPSDQWLNNFSARGMGVLTGGGVFLICKGKALAQFGEDIGSARDSQGRRWVDNVSLPASHKSLWLDYIEKLHNIIYDTIIIEQDGNAKRQKDFGVKAPDFEEPGEYWRSNDIWSFDNILAQGEPEEKRVAIRMYMEAVEKELKSGRWDQMLHDLFKFGGSHEDPITGKVSRQMWNEIFLVDTQILKALILVDSEGVNLPLEHAKSDPSSPFKKWKRKIKKIEFYHRQDRPIGADLKREVSKLEKLNSRIDLNKSGKFKFPTDYWAEV